MRSCASINRAIAPRCSTPWITWEVGAQCLVFFHVITEGRWLLGVLTREGALESWRQATQVQ